MHQGAYWIYVNISRFEFIYSARYSEFLLWNLFKPQFWCWLMLPFFSYKLEIGYQNNDFLCNVSACIFRQEAITELTVVHSLKTKRSFLGLSCSWKFKSLQTIGFPSFVNFPWAPHTRLRLKMIGTKMKRLRTPSKYFWKTDALSEKGAVWKRFWFLYRRLRDVCTIRSFHAFTVMSGYPIWETRFYCGLIIFMLYFKIWDCFQNPFCERRSSM